jgi:hypothetical protein
MIRALVTLLAVLVAGCTPRVNIDYDTSADLVALRTYRWVEPPPPPSDAPPYQDRPLMERRVHSSVDAALQGRGYRPDPARPDFLLNAFFVITPGYYAPDEAVTLVIDIVDPRTNTLLWRGTRATGLQRTDSAAERDEDIDIAVRAILEHFPPGGATLPEEEGHG